MGRISKEITNRIKKLAMEEFDKVINKEGYLTREELGKKYSINIQKLWRLIKLNGLPYNPELRRIKESEFLEWKSKNENLIVDQRIKNK